MKKTIEGAPTMNYIILNKSAKTPIYLQLYNYFVQEISTGKIKPFSKLPSIRKLSLNLAISKTTVQNAYDQLLAEGYICNHSRSHYSVCDFYKEPLIMNAPEKPRIISLDKIVYDFSSGDVPANSFNFNVWRKYLNSILRTPEILFDNFNNAGELTLRQQLTSYLKDSRGINAKPEQIIIGAGIQSLLFIVCQLLHPEYTNITFEKPGFVLAQQIFQNIGYDLNFIEANQQTFTSKNLPLRKKSLIYLTPSNQFPTGFIMPINQRLDLLSWANNHGNFIIEDDYESEFKYYGKPIPALKALDQADNVIYLGSLSKIIPAAIRISYLVLPECLLASYNQRQPYFKQTASSLEQLTLAKFIENGDFYRQIRRLRKIYFEKSTTFFNLLHSIFSDKIIFEKKHHGINVLVSVKTNYTAQQLYELALKVNCKIKIIEDYNSDFPTILLYFNKISNNDLELALRKLYAAWFS